MLFTISISLVRSRSRSYYLFEDDRPPATRPRLRLPMPSVLVFSCLGGGSGTWLFWSGWLFGCS